jgi:hypothetical protein
VPTKGERTERTENNALDQAIHGMLRTVHITGSWDADLGDYSRAGVLTEHERADPPRAEVPY